MLNNCHVSVSQRVQCTGAIAPTFALRNIYSVRLGTAYLIFYWKIYAESVLKYTCTLKKKKIFLKKRKKWS